MSFKVWQLHFIASLRGGISNIQEELGADWPLFSNALQLLVERLIRAADAAVAESIVDELIAHARTVSERCEYIDQLFVKTRPAYRGGGPGWEADTRPSNDRVWRNTYFDLTIPAPAPNPASRGAADRIVNDNDIITVLGIRGIISFGSATCQETGATVNRPALGRIKGHRRLLATLCALY